MTEYTSRRPNVELSADARALLNQVLKAHDDPRVTVADFETLLEAILPQMEKFSERERKYFFMEVAEVTLRNILNDPSLRVTGMGLGE